ncbi:MAG: DUF2089 domain-containing protein [Chloroflexi bacterium]|nr:DUF2089 domain-containing protein [Chloroflexota bacterium]
MANELLGRCPVCGDALHVTELHCTSCDTRIRSDFSLGRFARLSREQLLFLETFLRQRGVIKDVEEALGVSYPTVRSRLDDLLRTLGLTEEREQERENRREILRSLSEGRLSAEEAMALLSKVSSPGATPDR